MTIGRALAPLERCDEAQALLRHAEEHSRGLWSRAAAVMLRQGLEGALSDLWAVRAPGAGAASFAAQLALLPTILRDPALAGRVSFTWWALTQACHHREYELPPTVEELEDANATIRELIESVAACADEGRR